MRIILKLLLKDIHLESIETNFSATAKQKRYLDIIIKIATERGLDFSEIHGAIEADPPEQVNAEWNPLYP